MIQGLSLLGPCTAKVADEGFRTGDQRGVFIEVASGTALPQGYGTAKRNIVERDFREATVLTKNGEVLRFRSREDANTTMQSL